MSDALAIVTDGRLRIFEAEGAAFTEVVNMLYLGPTDDPAHLVALVGALRGIAHDERPGLNGGPTKRKAPKPKAPSKPKANGRTPNIAPKALPSRSLQVPRTIDAVRNRIAVLESLEDWGRPESASHIRALAKDLTLTGVLERRPDPAWTYGPTAGRQPYEYRLTERGRQYAAILRKRLTEYEAAAEAAASVA